MNSRTFSPLLSLVLGCASLGIAQLNGQAQAISSTDSAMASEPAVALPDAPRPEAVQKQEESLSVLLAQNQAPAPAQQPSSQTAPPAPSLGDLGFSAQQTQSDPKLQAQLDRRTHMLKVHQRLGLITIIPMAATLITGPMAKAEGKDGRPIKEPTQANLDFHAALGGATAAMYFTTAYYAMFAPRIPGTMHRGPIRLHEALAFIHGPGMIATPILGAMAFNQESSGERVHGAASAHGAVAVTTVLAYGAAMLAVAWPLKIRHHDPPSAISLDPQQNLTQPSGSSNLSQN